MAQRTRTSMSSWKRAVLWSLGGVALVLALMAGGAYALLYPTLRPAPEAAFPPPASPAEATRQDLTYLRKFADVNRSFTPRTRASFLSQVGALEARSGDLDAAALEMGVSRAVAVADDAHTNVRGAGFGLSLNALPIRVNWFQEGLFIVATDPAHADLLGARVTTEEGRTPAELAAALRPYIGGPESFRREHAPHFMISPAALHAAGLAASPEALDFALVLRSGIPAIRRIAAVPGPANGPPLSEPVAVIQRENHWPRRDLSPVRPLWDPRPWEHVLGRPAQLPLYLSNPNRFFWKSDLPEGRGLYLQINATRDQPGLGELEPFLAEVLEQVRRDRVRNVVVDLRFNPGGNSDKTMEFSRRLPEVLPADGRIFVLTSGNTLSAAIITTARLRHFGGERVIIAGERMGDREAFWAEGRPFVLPNSKILIKNTAAFHDWANGCSLSQIGYCYLFNYRWGVAAGDLSPDVAAPIKYSDYVDGVDTVLEAIRPLMAAAAR